uniref:Uncharacterized protein n=1 Tax=Escherichia coli TaxID=562 RepID=A0A5S9AWM3_ECOLX|nr:hypothetical protein [Escherichia coli]
MIDAKKMNKDLKENISADLFNSHFTKFIKAEGIYLYCSLKMSYNVCEGRVSHSGQLPENSDERCT